MTTASTIVKKAASYIGTKESPANSNNVVFNTDYYGRKVSGASYPWCCAFVWDIFRLCDASKLFYGGKKTAYCPSVVSWAKNAGIWLGRTSSPKAGDLVIFGNYGTACHIGIVEKKISKTCVQTIEGNTSTGTSGSQDNGGCVARRTRDYGSSGSSWYIMGFVRPKYSAEKTASTKTTTTTTKTTTTSKKTAQSSYVVKVVAKSGLNARKSASTSAKIMKVYEYGTKLTIVSTSKNGKWGKTSGGYWVFLAYTKKQ